LVELANTRAAPFMLTTFLNGKVISFAVTQNREHITCERQVEVSRVRIYI